MLKHRQVLLLSIAISIGGLIGKPLAAGELAAGELAAEELAVGKPAAGEFANGELDVLIQYRLGIEAKEAGNKDLAYQQFKNACMANFAIGDACLAWGQLAIERNNDKDVKRALGSAVMLEPENVSARYTLAVFLMKREDWVWAAEHLDEAVRHAKNQENKALLRYYLGYCKFKAAEYEIAMNQLALASRDLPADLAQRAVYFRALSTKEMGNTGRAVSLMTTVEDGPNEELAVSARNAIKNWSTFPRPTGASGNMIVAFGVDSRPYADILDTQSAGNENVTIDTTGTTVIRNTYRGDLVLGTPGYKYGVQEVFTFYREITLHEFDSSDSSLNNTYDFDLTMLASQTAFIARGWKNNKEHEFRAGVDGDLQFLDKMPEYDDVTGDIAPGAPDAIYGMNLGGKVWWSHQGAPNSTWNYRLKIDGRANRSNQDRSVLRTRLRVVNTRYYLDRTLKFRYMAGAFYDRAYADPHIVKYDRLAPEAWVETKWTTPWNRMSVFVGAKARYNWYMNSMNTADNKDNSFRPPFQEASLDLLGYSATEILAAEADYDSLRRKDFEWEATAELRFKLWKGGSLVAQYRHNSRYSNMDDAPKPMLIADDGTFYRYPTQAYGYHRERFFLDLRQKF